MPDVALSDTERKVLSYVSRGVSKDTAVSKISTFFSLTTNDALGAINSLRKQGLVIESKGISGVTVYTTSPLKVKQAMLDQQVLTLLKEAEQGGRASGFKRKTYTTDVETGEVMDEERAKRKIHSGAQKKSRADLGFDLVE
jgi:hypothetical protein